MDELKKTLNNTRLDINDSRRILTTDHRGHPLLIRKDPPETLPKIVVNSRFRWKGMNTSRDESLQDDKQNTTTSMNFFDKYMVTDASGASRFNKKKGKSLIELPDNMSTLSLPSELNTNCLEKIKPARGVIVS